jgi:hypothetical protein
MPTLPRGDARDALERWGREVEAILEPASDLGRAAAPRDGLGEAREGVRSLPPTLA